MDQRSSQLSNYFWSLKKGRPRIKCVVIPTPFTQFVCKYPQIKAESLHLKHILIFVVVHRATVMKTVHIYVDLPVCTYIYVLPSSRIRTHTLSSICSRAHVGCAVQASCLSCEVLLLLSAIDLNTLRASAPGSSRGSELLYPAL